MKANKGSLLYYGVLAVLGVLLIVGQQLFKDIMYVLVGIALIGAGLSSLLAWWKLSSFRIEASARLVIAVACVGLGIWILTHPGTFDTVVNVVIGAVLILSGLQWFLTGWRLGRRPLLMILGVIAVAAGFVIACNNAATTWLIWAEGIGLIYTAVTGFLAENRYR